MNCRPLILDRTKWLGVSLITLLMGCEDVIKVDTPPEEPRLIVESIIEVDVSENLTHLTARARLTSQFFGSVPFADLDRVTLTNLDTAIVLELFRPETGIYEEFVKSSHIIDRDLFLQFHYENERFLARATFKQVPEIAKIEQLSLASSNEGVSLEISFEDVAGRIDFYLFKLGVGELMVLDDTFFDGQTHQFIYNYNTKLEVGQTIEISILSIEEPFYHYMRQLISQSQESNSPFDTPVATLRGNIINVTDIDNQDFFDNLHQPEDFALGYFAVSQVHRKSIVVQ
ncbi:MAG: DUF4249 family protein [Cyclobacteriaceae bacterium]